LYRLIISICIRGLFSLSAKMVNICLIYICIYRKKIVPLHPISNVKIRK
jgi:hypothetical protein